MPIETLNVVILVITIIINSLFAFIVYKNSPKSATSIIFGLLSLVTSIWLFVNYIAVHPASLSISLLLSRLSIFFAVPQIALFFILSHTLPHEKLRMKRNHLFALVILSIVVMSITISPYAFTHIEIKNNAPQPTPGWGMMPFALFAIVFSISAIVTLIRRLNKSISIEKQQLRFVMFGILLMLGLLTTTVLIPVILFKNASFISLAPLYTLSFLGMTTYAIVKHRLLDIRRLVARTVAYTIFILAFGGIYSLVIFILGSSILTLSFSIKQIVFFVF